MLFIIALVAIVTIGRLIKAGMKLEERKLKLHDTGADEVARLQNENSQLLGKVARLEDRMAVLERIATDAPARLTAQIDELR